MKQSKIKSEKRERKKKPRMKISGRSVFTLRDIALKKAKAGKKKNIA